MVRIFPSSRASILIQGGRYGSGGQRRIMLTHLISWGGLAVELLLLVRGVQQKLVSRYPIFYSYILFIFASEIASQFFDPAKHPYLFFYWITEFLGLFLGCMIVFELYRIGLSEYPGTARKARAVLGVLFLIASLRTVIATAEVPLWWINATPAQVEGTLRVFEALAIISLVVLFLFYSIPFGRNLRGILLGYGIFVSWSVVCLTFASGGPDKSHSLWSYTYSASYVVALLVWAGHLWSYQPNPQPVRAIPLEKEYLRMAAATQRRLEGARGYLAKAVRS
jgi:hypothetical protein